MFRIFLLFLVSFFLVACLPKSPKQTTPTYTGGQVGGYSPTNTNTNQNQQNPADPNAPLSGNLVYVFKYTGRVEGRSEATNSELMGQQLNNVGIQWQEKLPGWTDGKTYTTGEFDFSSGQTGDIHVFGIDASQVSLSEQKGFCRCTLKRPQKVCAPIDPQVQSGGSSCSFLTK